MFDRSVRPTVLVVTLTMLLLGLVGGAISGLQPAVAILLTGFIASVGTVSNLCPDFATPRALPEVTAEILDSGQSDRVTRQQVR